MQQISGAEAYTYFTLLLKEGNSYDADNRMS